MDRINFSQVRALSFDSFGTLIDWETGIRAFIQAAKDDSELVGELETDDTLVAQIAHEQRQLQKIRPILGYRNVLALSWERACAALELECKRGLGTAFSLSLEEWPPFSDTVPALSRLSERFVLAVISNVDELGLARTIERLGAPFDVKVSADRVGAYKPDRAHFTALLDDLAARGIARHEIVHVAQSRFHDIAPARELGISTVWVNRRFDQVGRGLQIEAHAKASLSVNSLASVLSTIGDDD